jgi:hypothetical protein
MQDAAEFVTTVVLVGLLFVAVFVFWVLAV